MDARSEIKVRPAKDQDGDPTGEFFYDVTGANGEVLVVSETYTRERDAVRGAGDLIRAVVGSQLVEPTIIIEGA